MIDEKQLETQSQKMEPIIEWLKCMQQKSTSLKEENRLLENAKRREMPKKPIRRPR